MKNVLIFFLGVCLSLPMLQAQTTVNFAYTGGAQTWTVPVGVTSITVVANGASGGGQGGRVTATRSVTSGQILNIFVGEQGGFGGGGFGGGPKQSKSKSVPLSNERHFEH